MPNCKYCGQPAGFFHWQHAECSQKYEAGERQLALTIERVASDSSPLDSLATTLDQIAKQSYIADVQKRSLIVEAWTAAVDHSLNHGLLEQAQDERLLGIKNRLSLAAPHTDTPGGGYLRVVKAGAIREVMSGVVPHRWTVSTGLPVNLQKGEQVVWEFQNCDYLEDRVHRQYVGGSRGISVRLMKGLYYHMGEFKGHSVDRTDREHIDTGTVVVTDKNIYFAGPAKSLRVPYSKIVSFLPFENGIGLIRDAVSAKPQIFITHDGWFSYNLVTNLAKL